MYSRNGSPPTPEQISGDYVFVGRLCWYPDSLIAVSDETVGGGHYERREVHIIHQFNDIKLFLLALVEVAREDGARNFKNELNKLIR